MARASLTLALFACAALASGCGDDDARASVRIADLGAFRDGEGHLVVDVDVEASEAFGSSVGTYCLFVQFPAEPSYGQQCSADLEDGDTKTLRFVSNRVNIAPGERVRVTALVGTAQTDAADLVAP